MVEANRILRPLIILASVIHLCSTLNSKYNGLTAYNCTHEQATSEEFSLLPLDPCPDFKTQYLQDEEIRTIQLLQKREFGIIHGYGLKVVRTLTISRCDGITVTHEWTQRILDFDKDEVYQIYQTKLFRDDLMTQWDHGYIEVKANGTTYKNRNLIGWTSGNGYCGGKEFTLAGVEYEDAILQADYEILLYDGTMNVDLNRDLVKTFGGSTCTYSEGQCTDYIYGDIFWSDDTLDLEACDETTYLVLYEGISVVRSYQPTEHTGKTQVITVTQEQTAFSLIVTHKVLLCGITSFATEHPKLFITELSGGLKFFQKTKAHALDFDLNAYRDSKFIHLERHLGNALSEVNAHVMEKICKLQAQVVSTLQTMAYSDAMGFAYSFTKRKGYDALVRGEVLHLIKCTPVQVRVRSTPYCSNELPVQYLNESLFMHPRTHILTRHAELVPCSTLYASKFKLLGSWFVLSPHLVKTQAPAVLQTNLNFSNWQYQSLKVGTAGIYSVADLNRQRTAVLFPTERRSITRQIADTAAGIHAGPHTINLQALVDESHLTSMMESLWEKFDGKARIFGAYSGLILGIGYIYRTLTGACEGTVNGTAVSSMFGKIWGCLACIFPSLAHIALLYGKEEQERSGRTKIKPKAVWATYKKRHLGKGKNKVKEEEEDRDWDHSGIIV